MFNKVLFIIVVLNTFSEQAFSQKISDDIFINSLNMQMVKVHPGSFNMGSPPYEKYRVMDEGPVHKEEIDEAFWVADSEVTQAQWTSLMGTNIRDYHSIYSITQPLEGLIGNQLPMFYVSWFDAMEFINKLNIKEKDTLPQGYMYMLPTEQEWEYFARAGTNTMFSFSAPENRVDTRYLNVYSTSKTPTLLQSGSLIPNPWNLYNIHGNLGELTYDYYKPYPGGKIRPRSEPEYQLITVRGGSYRSVATGSRTAVRRPASVQFIGDWTVGFRVILKKMGKEQLDRTLQRLDEITSRDFKVIELPQRSKEGKLFTNNDVNTYVINDTINSTAVVVYNANDFEKKLIPNIIKHVNIAGSANGWSDRMKISTVYFFETQENNCDQPVVRVYSNKYKATVTCESKWGDAFDVQNNRSFNEVNVLPHGYGMRISSTLFEINRLISNN